MNEILKTQMKRAYERGRLRAALKFLWIVVPLTIISICLCGSETLPLLLGCILAVSVVALKWRGKEYGAAVAPGLIAGLVAFVIPITLHLFELCCHNNLEVFFCGVSGVLGGIVVGRLTAKSHRSHRGRLVLFAVVIAGATATLGCASLEIGAILGLLSALIFAAISSFFLSRISNRQKN